MPLGAHTTQARNPQLVSKRVTQTVAIGTLGVAILLTLLLVTYDISVAGQLRVRTILGFCALVYILVSVYLVQQKRLVIASWMLVALYQVLAFLTLYTWGINAPVGVLATCFAVAMPGILLGSRTIVPVLIYTIALIVIVQILHTHGPFTPDTAQLANPSTYWDVTVYATIMTVFALLTWLSKSQSEQAVTRANTAERRLKQQKLVIAAELKQESAALRQAQLKQNRQLYQFAIIGQSAAATLHELSNQISELNLDIDDLHQTTPSPSMESTRVTIDHINQTVKQARRQINSTITTQDTSFLCTDAVSAALDDVSARFSQRQVQLVRTIDPALKGVLHKGSALSLMQVISILLNNALDACQDLDNPWVEVVVQAKAAHISITVTDSGPGIPAAQRDSIFTPTISTKPAGLGMGLYIATHITKTQLHGTLSLAEQSETHGAQFILTLPIYTKSRARKKADIS